MSHKKDAMLIYELIMLIIYRYTGLLWVTAVNENLACFITLQKMIKIYMWMAAFLLFSVDPD